MVKNVVHVSMFLEIPNPLSALFLWYDIRLLE
jgi:hypothetical protein